MATSGGPNIVKSGLVLSYDIADRGSYVSGSSIVYDLSGNGHHGTIQGSGITFSEEKQGTLEFPADNASHILVGSSSAYNSLTEITVEAIVKFQQTSSYEYIVSNARDCCGSYAGYEFQADGSNINWNIWSGSNNPFTSYPNELGRWYYLHGTYDGSNLRLYVDGQLKDTQSWTNGIEIPATYPLYVGRMGHGATYDISGSIAHVSIYDRPLSEQEIQQNYNALKNRFNL
jgi:hypothetical protein